VLATACLSALLASLPKVWMLLSPCGYRFAGEELDDVLL
jgi:hypothetical protein